MLIVGNNVMGKISLKKITDENSSFDFDFMKNIKPERDTRKQL